VLSRPGVASVILGCRNRDQLEEAVKAAGQLFPPEHAVEVDQLFPPPAPVGDEKVLYWRDQGWALEAFEQ
jgi:aryl-alcohol dehydrogenase-like predicted oxidoreductase